MTPGGHLVMVTDLMQNRRFDAGSFRITGMTVHVIHLCASANPSVCSDRERTWTDRFTELGAASVDMTDASGTAAVISTLQI